MNALVTIYIIGALAAGFLAGIIVELLIDNKTFIEQRKHIERLKMENDYLIRHGQTETIEIVDKTIDRENVPSFDQEW